MGAQKSWVLWALLTTLVIAAQSIESTTEDNSQEEELISANYVLPKQIFNDGKPFYVDKDPISGQLDFSSKKPAGIEPEVNEVIDPKEKTAVLSSVSPNFHDFLNLPVKYSSSKFVYPLVSSSYANLKYQGNNKNFVSNHKNYTTTTSTTSTPKYYTLHKVTSGKVRPTPIRITIDSSTWRPFQEVIPEKTTTKHKFVPTKKLSTTEKPTTKNAELQITRKPSKPITTTTAATKRTTTEKTTPTTVKTTTTVQPTKAQTTTKHISTTATSTTMKSTTPTSKVPPSTRGPILLTSTSLKVNKTTIPPKSTTSIKTTRPSIVVKSTSVTTVKPTDAPVSTTTTSLSTLDVADVYNGVGNKMEPNTMSLADLFNALAEEESPYKPSNDGLDSQGNLMQPFSPARPAPFTLHQVTKVSSLPKPATTSTTTSTTTEKILHDISEQDANNYVRYEVQQPNVMQMQYHSAPPMNNIVISPGQHSASFVLGSQQTFGSNNLIGSVEKEPLFQNGQRIQYGTVINEDLVSAMRPEPQPLNATSSQEFYFPNENYAEKPVIDGEHQMQGLTVSNTNVRFPNDLIGNTAVNYGGVPEIVNGHAQPIALPHVQTHPVVFPPNDNTWQTDNNREENAPVSNVVFKDENLPEQNVPQKHEVLSLNQHNHHNQVSFPQLPEDLTPPQPPEEQPIPYLTSSPPHLYNEFTRKPLLGLHRPNQERPLPNILPQFRPNAKISSGPPPHHKEHGNIRVHQKLPYPNRSLPPPFSHRRTPIGNRYNPKVNLDPVEANRRVYRVPPHQIERVYMHRHPQIHNRPPPPVRYGDSFGMERNPINADIYNIPSIEVKPERLPAFEEEDLMVEDPPKPTMGKEPEAPQLEPVVTLQMLKSQKKPQSDVLSNNDAAPPQAQKNNGQSPVYVVYPVKSSPLHMDMFDSTDMEDPIVIGQRGEQPPQPPVDKDISADYQNTPFSVVRDHPQEPILMAKNKSQPNKSNFPYLLEKPDPAFAEFSEQRETDRFDRNANIEISPRVVNRGSTNNDDPYKNTDIPIAIAYTPTEPSKYYQEYPAHDKYSHPNLASPVIPEIRDTQTEATISEEPDTRGQYFEKDFMAPFYPSMSLSSVTNSPNGWSVYPGTTDGSVYEKNNINRVDLGSSSKEEDSTKKFDPEHFQPELQGGFKPIYPPGYKIKDSSVEEVAKPIVNIESSSTTTTTTEKPPERKKSKLQASIESLLFGDDADFEDDEPTEMSNSSTSS